MQFLILAAGKPSLGYAKEGVELYLNRLRPFGKVELKLVRDGNSQDVSKRLLAASEGCLRVIKFRKHCKNHKLRQIIIFIRCT